MTKPIRLHQAFSDQSSQRINAFPGRNLSEHAFNLMQAHVDQRIDPLLGNNIPGIVEGLQLTTHSAGKNLQMHVQPGTAIGADGRAIRVFFPIELDWDALISAHRLANDEPEISPDGFYFLTVRRMLGRVQDDPDARPCTRDQLDPLRDSRIETYATLDLQFITDLDSLRDMTQQRAVNHLCVRFLSEPVFNSRTGAVPLAIMFIDKGLPMWVDSIGGRFLAREEAPFHTFAAHWERVLESFDSVEPFEVAEKDLSPRALIPGMPSALASSARITSSDVLAEARLRAFADTRDLSHGGIRAVMPGDRITRRALITGESELPRPLREVLGVDYMPAAGRFPDQLLADIAGQETGDGGDEWTLPQMMFNPRDLQIELLPIPASSALGVIRRELPRGVIDLNHHEGDRLRLMVAVEDSDYRADLMDLAEVDHALIDELYERAQSAMQAELDWAYANRALYADLDEQATDEDGNLTDEARLHFKNTYLVPAYSTQCGTLPYDDYPNLDETQRKALGVPAPVCPVRTPQAFLDDLRTQGGGRPYTNTDPSAPEDYEEPTFSEVGEPGLYRQSYKLSAEIEKLEEDLEGNHDLIDEINDFLSIQRQHLDSITTKFAALAGGVAGDGSGLRLMRWNGALRFEPKTASTETSENPE